MLCYVMLLVRQMMRFDKIANAVICDNDWLWTLYHYLVLYKCMDRRVKIQPRLDMAILPEHLVTSNNDHTMAEHLATSHLMITSNVLALYAEQPF